MLSTAALADETYLAVDGLVTNSTCAVENTHGRVEVDMGKNSVNALNALAKGTPSLTQNFNINLKECPASYRSLTTGELFSNVAVTFVGGGANVEDGNLKNIADGFRAENLQVQISDVNGKVDLSKADASSHLQALVKDGEARGDIQFDFKADYVRTGLVTPGIFHSHIPFKVDYK
ncbi:MAG: fimbrial protein [Moraxella sp.]|nr:fimbrial protein [Moraxella sp.]